MLVKFTPNRLGKVVILVLILLALLLGIRKRKQLKQIAMNTINYLKEKTWDIHSDRRINSLHPKIRAKAKEFIIRAEKELGIKLRVTKGFRSIAEQDALYNQPWDGKDNDGDGKIDESDEKVTKAKGGKSYHNYGLAIDVVEIKNGKALWKNPNWDKIGALGKKVGFEWGGDWKSFKDRPHFEMRYGYHHTELAKMYREGNRKGEFVNIA